MVASEYNLDIYKPVKYRFLLSNTFSVYAI